MVASQVIRSNRRIKLGGSLPRNHEDVLEDLIGNVAMPEDADNHSIRLCRRAFRQATGQSPHRWLWTGA
jgi:hypothetical protein